MTRARNIVARLGVAQEAARSVSPPDPATTWLSLCAAGAAPSGVRSMLELDGYLTGVVVSPDHIEPDRWIEGLWRGDEAVFDDRRRSTKAFASVVARYGLIREEIDAGVQDLEAERLCAWRPIFQPSSGKADRGAVLQWAHGFWKAAALQPEGWSAYVEDERLRPIITPLASFAPFHRDLEDAAEEIDDLLDEAAAAIPHSIVVLRLIAQMRAESAPKSSRIKIGRNDPCPCGSSQKYKRCCGGA